MAYQEELAARVRDIVRDTAGGAATEKPGNSLDVLPILAMPGM